MLLHEVELSQHGRLKQNPRIVECEEQFAHWAWGYRLVGLCNVVRPVVEIQEVGLGSMDCSSMEAHLEVLDLDKCSHVHGAQLNKQEEPMNCS